MQSSDLRTSLSSDMAADMAPDMAPNMAIERLEPAASAPALQDHPPGELPRKTRRRARPERASPQEEAEVDVSPTADEEPEHKIDRLA
jgi:hypothetical protein